VPPETSFAYGPKFMAMGRGRALRRFVRNSAFLLEGNRKVERRRRRGREAAAPK